MHQRLTNSLRFRLLGPLIATAAIAVVGVSIASSWLGTKWATDDLNTRYDGIETALARSSFPLNSIVLDSLAKLTQTELVTIGSSGRILNATLTIESMESFPVFSESAKSQHRALATLKPRHIGERSYFVYQFAIATGNIRSDNVDRVVVLFDEEQVAASRRRATLLPLITGLSTILALSSVTLFLSTRLVTRLGKLRRRVESVADGDFKSVVSDHNLDEIGRLGGAVDTMAGQLDRLWNQINRQQSANIAMP